jgi:single-strand DNA-binding protein
MAVSRWWKNAEGEQQEATEWINIESWGRLAELCENYLNKGRLVYIEGRLQTDQYEREGEKRYFTKVVTRDIQILDRKPGEAEGAAADIDTEEVPF